ncbi:hypothetical protein SETIT_7G015300v2 [Setaria italica]|uniref:F-box domain-containing protein n=2 Tax=Setaria italica TaxID=4555 RepID=A0A368RSR7_SETIT|nr:hypothetical protein SETIT_7G015300v2 [Setaria italica]
MAAATRSHPDLLASSSPGPGEVVADHQALPYIPDDLILAILRRLPAKSVLRFRCVSKAWLAMLSSRSFVDAHLEFSAAARPTMLIVPGKYHLLDPRRLRTAFWMGFYKYTSGGADTELLHGERFPGGVASWFKPMHCDGLILVYTRHQELMVCNPATREFVQLLRETERDCLSCLHDAVGFGRDPRSNTYKVVRLFYSSEHGGGLVNVFSCRAEVLTLGTNQQWRRVATPPRLFNPHPAPVHVSGFIYWSDVSDPNNLVLLRFNLATETFAATPYPPCKLPGHACLAEWEGELCCFWVPAPAELVEIWTCDGKADAPTWTRRISVRLPTDTITPGLAYAQGPPTVTFHGKDMLLRGCRKLYRYSVETEEMKRVAVAVEDLKYDRPVDSDYLQKISGEKVEATAFHVVNYAESLVRIRGSSTDTLKPRAFSVWLPRVPSSSSSFTLSMAP